MNKKIMLMLVTLLGVSSLVRASEPPVTPPATFWSKVVTFLGNGAKNSVNWPALLLQKIKRFEGMATWKAATFDVVVYAIIIGVAKVAYDKYQERKRRSKEEKAIKDILAKFEQGEELNEEEETKEVESEEAQPAS